MKKRTGRPYSRQNVKLCDKGGFPTLPKTLPETKKDPRDSIATTWLQNDSGDDKTHAKASLNVFYRFRYPSSALPGNMLMAMRAIAEIATANLSM